MDELRRIVGGTNSRYIEEVKGRWAEFCAKVQFYGVWKKVLKPPFPLDVRSGKLLFHTICICIDIIQHSDHSFHSYIL